MRRKTTLLLIGILTAVCLLPATVLGLTALEQHLEAAGVGKAYRDLVAQLETQYNFSDAQLTRIQENIDQVVAIAETCGDLLEQPDGSFTLTADQFSQMKTYLLDSVVTAGFYCTETAQDSATLYSVYDQVDDRLLFTLKVEEDIISQTLPGDMNQDGQRSVTDVVLLRKQILAGRFNAIGDMNGDTTLSVTDVVLLRKAILQG